MAYTGVNMSSETVEQIIKAVRDRSSGTLSDRFAVFDFDNSCIVNDINEALLAYLCRNSLLRNEKLVATSFADTAAYHRDAFLEYHHLLEQGKVREAYLYAVIALAGFAKSEIESLVSKTIESEGEIIGKENLFGIDIAKGLAVRPHVKALMEEVVKTGCKVYVVTASSEEVVKSALHYWHFPEVPCLGVRNEERDGIFTDAIQEPAPIIEGKVACIKQCISPDKHPILAVGDSVNDLPMLEYSDIKVVVDRGNALAKKAQENNWFLI